MKHREAVTLCQLVFVVVMASMWVSISLFPVETLKGFVGRVLLFSGLLIACVAYFAARVSGSGERSTSERNGSRKRRPQGSLKFFQWLFWLAFLPLAVLAVCSP